MIYSSRNILELYLIYKKPLFYAIFCQKVKSHLNFEMFLCSISPQTPSVSSQTGIHRAGGKTWQHFACPFGALILEVESCKSKIRVRLLKISGFRHFCQIRDIPLLVGMQSVSTSSGQALCASAGQKGGITLHDREGNGISQILQKGQIPEIFRILAGYV
jgi:hypothetical protein